MKKGNLFYYIATILSIFKIIEFNSLILNLPESIDKILDIIIYMSFGIKLIMQKYKNLKELMIIILIGLLSMLSAYICKDTRILISYLAIIAMDNIDIKNILCIDMIEKIIIILYHMIIYFADVFAGTISLTLRNNFYFSHPNTISALVLWCSIDFIYLNSYRKKDNYFVYLCILIFQLFLFYYTKSRTPIITFIILIILMSINNKKVDTMIKKVSKLIFPILSLFILSFFNFYDQINSIFSRTISKLDTLLSGRIFYSRLAFYNYHMTLFPKFINYISSINGRDIIVDNIYVRFGVSYGIIFLIIISIVLYKINDNNTKLDNILLVIVSIVGLSEKYVLNVFFCFPLLIIGKNLYKKVKKDEII